MITYLPSLEEFRRRRDWYGLRDVAARLPALAARLDDAKAARAALAAEVSRYTRRKERVPAALEDEYNAAAWDWQRAYAAYTLAQKTYSELLAQHPEWAAEVERAS